MHMAAAALGEAKQRVRHDLLATTVFFEAVDLVVTAVTAMTGDLEERSRE
jgi:hypothetical protein